MPAGPRVADRERTSRRRPSGIVSISNAILMLHDVQKLDKCLISQYSVPQGGKQIVLSAIDSVGELIVHQVVGHLEDTGDNARSDQPPIESRGG